MSPGATASQCDLETYRPVSRSRGKSTRFAGCWRLAVIALIRCELRTPGVTIARRRAEGPITSLLFSVTLCAGLGGRQRRISAFLRAFLRRLRWCNTRSRLDLFGSEARDRAQIVGSRGAQSLISPRAQSFVVLEARSVLVSRQGGSMQGVPPLVRNVIHGRDGAAGAERDEPSKVEYV